MRHFAYLLFSLLFVSCAPFNQDPAERQSLAYIPHDEETLLSRWAPIFITENPDKSYNRIGIPVVEGGADNNGIIVVDPDIPAVYVEERHFTTAKDSYTNLIYRIHFPEIPHALVPFQIGAGKNIGLLVIVTINSSGQPVLYTTVHTCGCYLAFIPTSYLPADAFPANRPSKSRQSVYGENLPKALDFTKIVADNKVMVLLRNGSHRVRDIWRGRRDSLAGMEIRLLPLLPASLLERLPVDEEKTVSFFEESGSRKGYVKGSYKYWERLLMSWWVFDWRIGEDKKLGRDKDDLPLFYTSLKPWAREESDMRDFSTFLAYWGWDM